MNTYFYEDLEFLMLKEYTNSVVGKKHLRYAQKYQCTIYTSTRTLHTVKNKRSYNNTQAEKFVVQKYLDTFRHPELKD